MKPFLDDNFLLESQTAQTLFHKYAKAMPIFDYHSHLIPKQIAENTRFANLYEVWLTGDHYKWRAMRSFGISEKFITGDATPFEKYMAYATMIPHTIGNPLYHWTHLELQRYFNITTPLSPDSAQEIWDTTAALLEKEQWGARDFLRMSNVKAACTTDDPIDTLEYHKSIAADPSFMVRVLPTFRPDKALAVLQGNQYRSYIGELGKAAGIEIHTYQDLISALEKRHEYFHAAGCRISDHALTAPIFAHAEAEELHEIFTLVMSGSRELTNTEAEKIQTGILIELARMNRDKEWTMQLHIGALRNNNQRQFKNLGPDTGYDSIADAPIAHNLSRFLDAVETKHRLPKTIIYCLNPSHNYTIATMIGNFQDGEIPGKIQFGSGWWFNDQRDGMTDQIKALANLGLLSKFVGMLTDSRSFLSFPRHEYFRRILCNIIGGWVENGEYPWDEQTLGAMVENICFNNARDYFGIEMN